MTYKQSHTNRALQLKQTKKKKRDLTEETSAEKNNRQNEAALSTSHGQKYTRQENRVSRVFANYRKLLIDLTVEGVILECI